MIVDFDFIRGYDCARARNLIANKAIKEDYEQFVSIMNRARRLVALETDSEPAAPTFKMERNGNLISQSSLNDSGEAHY